uniref:Fungal lipase-type domain-containing protein n=1 Tax=Araucaria cunninghamii TaxID=56994 RepID=A0A0D6QS52_ARACU
MAVASPFTGLPLSSRSPHHHFRSGPVRCSRVKTGFTYGQKFLHSPHWTKDIQMEKIGKRSLSIRNAATESLPDMLTALEGDKTEVKEPKRKLAEMWREVQGANNWEGLLDPFDDVLRKEIIRYGEFAQACYDGFDFDPFSKYSGSCKYHFKQLFQGVGMSDYGYKVTKYLYATSNINLPGFFQRPRVQKLWSRHANWMGFIAVATDEQEIKRLGRRDIVVAWRGTVTYLEWIADLMDYLRPATLNYVQPHPDVKVESGFLNLYTARDEDCRFCKSSARDQVVEELKRLVAKYKGEQLSITITGHSLGSALAMLSAYDIAELGLNCPEGSNMIPVTVFSFAGPRVGNGAFKDRCEELGLKFLRIVNVHDGVPKVPGILFNEKFRLAKEWVGKLPWSYCHVGVELALDHTISPFLKPTNDPSCFHNLEAHLHLLDGFHGAGQRFVLTSGRDPALVNKACDFLKDHYLVPPFWRQDANKGLLKNSEGRCVQPDRTRIIDESHADEAHDTVNGVSNVTVNGHALNL